MIARQRLRMYPLDFGDSSYMTSVNLNEVDPVPGHLTRLLKHVNYRGIFSAEFKRDERDGELKLIEVNTRAWAYIQFSMMCGANVAGMAVADALNEPIKNIPDSYVRRSMKIFPKDLKAARSAVRSGEICRMSVIRQWLSARSSIFSWGDPVPWIVQRYDDISNSLRRRLRPLFGANPSL
jgi:predicted ATP-grasp superfamily ATP-dependent carboligase